jgi:hypothetical protein
MLDTIELLDTIGRDASLRHASAEDLTNMLQHAQASEALIDASAHGDGSLLFAELGQKQNEKVQSTQSPAHEEEEEEDEESEEKQAPEER